MGNLQRRSSGIYVARLVVPARLRHVIGRREFIASTGTAQQAIAKLVGATLLARWRQQLFDLDRLAQTGAAMDDDSLRRLHDESPLLAAGIGHLPLIQAAHEIGVTPADLLRKVSERSMRLFHHFVGAMGYLVPYDALEVDEPEHGTRVVPNADQMPEAAIAHRATGMYAVLKEETAIFVDFLIASVKCEAVMFEAPGGDSSQGFVPDKHVVLTTENVAVSAGELRDLRVSLIAGTAPERLAAARSASSRTAPDIPSAGGKWAQKRFVEALEDYCARPDGLPEGLTSPREQGQRKKGMLLFAEFMGDLKLNEIDGDKLREFRDGPLKTFPGKANHLPGAIKKGTMKETIAALRADGREWPLMSSDMQRERMQWLFRFFEWLDEKEHFKSNLAASLRGETGLSKSDRKKLAREKLAARSVDGGAFDLEDEGRGPFSQDELKLIFSVPHYLTGDGQHVIKRNETWYPFQYWLPLLGLFAGCRIKEASQLHLSDVRQVEDVWCLDLNDRTEDKSIKSDDGTRLVPVHPKLIELGFIDYCQRLRMAGRRRVFPELTYAKSDARYAKESGRKMSKMLEKLGMPRDNTHVFHCLRHNANNALIRVPKDALPFDDESLKFIIRHKVIGHVPSSSNGANLTYTDAPIKEKSALVSGVKFELPELAAFNIEYGLARVAAALEKKTGDRRGREDMGPLNEKFYGKKN